MHVLHQFYGRHECHATLPLRFPGATLIKDACQLESVDVYRQCLRQQTVCHSIAIFCRKKAAVETHNQVARRHAMIVWPLQSAQACIVSALAMLQCESIFQKQVFYGSQLSAVQQTWRNKYPKVDFDFWVKYGSWSFCTSCRSFYFNDKYFREHVYMNTGTSTTPEAMADTPSPIYTYRQRISGYPGS